MSIRISTRAENRLHNGNGAIHLEKKTPAQGLHTQDDESKRTIVLYSPDTDFCVSLRMLFQETYNIVTTTEPDIMMMLVKSFKPDVVIVDSLPTAKMQERFALMRKFHPGVHIMIFYASSMESNIHHELIRQSVDAAFSKPIDLTEVMKSISRFAISVH